jgi:AraC-like DNA-binding protein
MGERAPPLAESVEASLLAKKPLAEGGDFVLETVECRCGTTGWSAPEAVARFGIIFVRKGCFHRRLNGADFFVDPTVVYFERPGDEQQIAHPGAGDSCTALYLSEELLAAIWGGEPGLPEAPVPTDAVTDLRQRLLLAGAGREDGGDVAELVLSLAADVLERSAPERVQAGRPATAATRRRVAADTREALAENPRAGVVELARRVCVSPHHLSRVFKAETGQTISSYRNQLRIRLALERLAAGEPCLARLAADLGFADQGHLARVVRGELGTTPSSLRELLGRQGAREGDPALDPRR